MITRKEFASDLIAISLYAQLFKRNVSNPVQTFVCNLLPVQNLIVTSTDYKLILPRQMIDNFGGAKILSVTSFSRPSYTAFNRRSTGPIPFGEDVVDKLFPVAEAMNVQMPSSHCTDKSISKGQFFFSRRTVACEPPAGFSLVCRSRRFVDKLSI